MNLQARKFQSPPSDPLCSMGDKVPAGWVARPLRVVSGWKGNRKSRNVVSGRQLQDHVVPWPRLTDKEPEVLMSMTRPRPPDWLVAASSTQGRNALAQMVLGFTS